MISSAALTDGVGSSPAQPGQLVGVAEQRLHAAGQGERRGVVAGRGDDDVVPEPLDVAHRAAVDLAVGDDAWRGRRRGRPAGPR